MKHKHIPGARRVGGEYVNGVQYHIYKSGIDKVDEHGNPRSLHLVSDEEKYSFWYEDYNELLDDIKSGNIHWYVEEEYIEEVKLKLEEAYGDRG